MGRPRGVKREIVRLPLSDGDWIDVKRWLTVGEERDRIACGIKGYRPDGTADLDMSLMSYLTAATYLVAWSFVDHEGHAIPWITTASLPDRVKILRSLDAATMREIEAALAAHEEAQQADPPSGSGANGGALTSPSAE